MSIRQTTLQLAALKAVKDHVAKVDTETKNRLMEDLDPGDRKTAALPDGTKVGTVSVSAREAALKVVDERAFLRWVKENRPTAIVEAVRESDRKSILEQATTTGEIPDGVELGDPGDPYVTVRQSAEQREALIAAWQSGVIELPNVAGQIEGADQ